MHLPVQDLTPQAFAPFGTVLQQPDQPADASGPGWNWWEKTGSMEGDARPYSIGYLDLRPADLTFDWAERHMHSAEVLIPVKGDCLVYVGPADHPEEPGKLPPLERFRVFRIRPGQGVLMNRGVWHGAPLAVDSPLNVFVLLLKDSGRIDNHLVCFEDMPVRIVLTSN